MTFWPAFPAGFFVPLTKLCGASIVISASFWARSNFVRGTLHTNVPLTGL